MRTRWIYVRPEDLPEEWREEFPYGLHVEDVRESIEAGEKIETLAYEYSDGNRLISCEANDVDFCRTLLEVSDQL